MTEATPVREEQTETHVATGIEAEEPLEETPDRIDVPFNPDQIDVTTRNPTVDLLLSRIRSGSIDLAPDFQRHSGIWTDQRQSRLIESLLLRIPLPTLYAAEDENEVWAIVDGVQRLSTIVRFVEPELSDLGPLRLVGLEYLAEQYNGCTYDELPGRLQLRLRETELVLHLIRNGTPEEVKFNIFARINTGGMPLSAQELRHAMIPGPARAMLKRMAELPSFKRATGSSIKDERMADREMALRFAAFHLTPASTYGSQDFDDFLRRTMRALNGFRQADRDEVIQAYDRAMESSLALMGSHAFRKVYVPGASRYPINKALFEAESVTLASMSDTPPSQMASKRDQAIDALCELMKNYTFERSISQGTGDIAKVRYRFEQMDKLFGDVLG